MTQGVDLELDHLTAQLTQHLERALIAARRAAQQRAAQHRVLAARSTALGHEPAMVELAHRWRTQALAARWAAADALRATDPLTATAWDTRITDTGVDLEKVHRESEIPTGGDNLAAEPRPAAAASDLVAEHLAEAYTDDAVASALTGAPLVHDPTAAELITAATPDHLTPDPPPVPDPPAPILAAEVSRLRDAEQDLGLDR